MHGWVLAQQGFQANQEGHLVVLNHPTVELAPVWAHPASRVSADIREVCQTLLASLSGVVQYETLLGIGAVSIGPMDK